MLNKIDFRAENSREFHSLFPNATIIETEQFYCKNVTMFASKCLLFWKKSGKISVRNKPFIN